MNFVKRAGFSLRARKGRTLTTFATFLVISVMVLAGVLVNAATGRAEQAAKRSVGAQVNLGMDLEALGGGTLQAPRIATGTLDRLGRLPQVRKYTYWTYDRVLFTGDSRLVGAGSPMGPGGTAGIGVLDSSLLDDFRSGTFTLLSGHHLTSADRKANSILIEERFARQNGLNTGDKVAVTGNDENTTADFTVAGIYRDPARTNELDRDYGISPADRVYVTLGGMAALGSGGGQGGTQVGEAAFLLDDAEAQDAFKDEARQLAGSQLDGFELDANDKAVQQMTGPLKSISSTATLAMWLIGVAGAVVLALLVNLAVKQRRREYGVLLSLGEKKWKLITQQALEIAVVAALAIGLGSLCAPDLTQSAGQRLLDREAATAQKKIDSWEPPAPGSTGLDQGLSPDDRPVDNADPVDEITVEPDPADLAAVGGIGLGMALLATAIPAAAVLRLNPRTILTKGT
ncbi:ABC transporter permease [Streptomyces sp. MAR4 CNX-425]|uniref:ABC transporter permease n=1 Tax=Streptomyces sp. MAR4 CNX-425 TaxID=3406343 RepID=UPI003B511213